MLLTCRVQKISWEGLGDSPIRKYFRNVDFVRQNPMLVKDADKQELVLRKMNYYGTDDYIRHINELEIQIFSKIDFQKPDRVSQLENGFCVKYYYYADEENRVSGCAPVDGEICRLYANEELVYEWKNTYGNSRFAKIIHHSDGEDYLVFDEDLYGYSVLKLSDFSCMHYLPAESYGDFPDIFEETFIWCNIFYNAENNMMAVDGCYWACPENVVVLDFSNPMQAVEAKEWSDLYSKCCDTNEDLDEIVFEKWDGPKLVCKADGMKPEGFNLNGKVEVEFI